MKLLSRFITFAILFFSAVAYSGPIGIEVGMGSGSRIGILGLGVRYFLTDDLDVSATSAIDRQGGLYTLGTRYYWTVDDTCWFILSCESRVSVSLSMGRRSEGDRPMTNEDGTESNYWLGEQAVSFVDIGFFDLYGESFFTNIGLGYRHPLSEFKITHLSGPDSDDFRKQIKANSMGIRIEFGVGILF